MKCKECKECKKKSGYKRALTFKEGFIVKTVWLCLDCAEDQMKELMPYYAFRKDYK